MAAPVCAALHDVDTQLAVDRVRSMEQSQQDSVAAPRLITILLSLFAVLALIISAFGIAAVLALSVSNARTNSA